MDAIYDRMADSIAQNSSSTSKALAKTVLECISCSLRTMTVAELFEAIGHESSGVLDFQQSVVDLCGGFVVIDNGDNVAMVHQTAREYLSNRNNSTFQIDYNIAHRQLFLSCMRCLMSPSLRGKVHRNAGPEFLDYASTWWSSHLSHTSLGDEDAIETLTRFLSGHWVLTWIQIIATNKAFPTLVQASQHLSKYCSKWRKEKAAQDGQGIDLIQQQLLESWYQDLIKIVGKFGSSLRRSPESIHKLIPPFCPPTSAIYQQFGKQEARNLAVTGQTTDSWDDLIARLPLGFGVYASSVCTMGKHVAILASSGVVQIFDSSTFEEIAASPIRHGERLYRMELNSTGTLLVTHGFKTTKLWDIRSGRCKLTVANIESRPRPLAMLLMDNNTKLLVGVDDRRILSLDLTDPSSTWQDAAKLEEPELEGHFLNSSSYMAFNSDGSLIAVAYRGHPLSAWETDGPVHIGHCWRQGEELTRGQVIDAAWHPYAPEVLGLYIEGIVFKWSPYEGEVEELTTGASKLAISRDGNLFATGDVHGIVKIFNTLDFSLVYQLASQDSILGLAFSPDSNRFYDIRGEYGNAWEPSALMRFTAQAGRGLNSDNETTSIMQSTIATASYTKVQSITTLVASSRGRFYCYGTEYGSVRLFDKFQNQHLNAHTPKGFLSIEQMAWSEDGTCICFSDSSKKIFVKSIAVATPGTDVIIDLRTELSVKSNTEGPILQLLFNSDSASLFVYTSSTICLISLGSSAIVKSLKWHTDKCRWLLHPQDSSLLLGIAPGHVHVMRWDLVEIQTCVFETQILPEVSQGKETVSNRPSTIDRVLITQDQKRILVQVSHSGEHTKAKTFLFFETSSFATSKSVGSGLKINTTPALLPHATASEITLALSFLSHDRLVYLSKHFALCTWRLPPSSDPMFSAASGSHRPEGMSKVSGSARPPLIGRPSSNISANSDKTPKELFLLPGDWIGRDCLTLSCIWPAEKSLMVPRNGEVALVRSAALA